MKHLNDRKGERWNWICLWPDSALCPCALVHYQLCYSSNTTTVSVSGIQVSSQAVHSVSFDAARELNSNVNESVPLCHKHKMKYSSSVSDNPSYIDSLCTVLYSLSLRLRYLPVSLQHAHHIRTSVSLSVLHTNIPPNLQTIPLTPYRRRKPTHPSLALPLRPPGGARTI